MSETERFRVIYDAHHAAICAYFARRVARDEVEDLAAETFVVAWRKLPRRTEHPLPGCTPWRARCWPTTAARRPGAGTLPADPATGDPAERVGGDRGLARAFAELGERDREAICLVAWEGLSTADAARAAGCSAATFAVRLSRARKRLARALDDPHTTTFAVPERI